MFFPLEVKHPFSIWIQISSLSFFLAGNFSDLLIIRCCLSSAYIFLFLNSILGAPLWPSLWLPHHVQLDGVVWACLNLYVHLSTVTRLLMDEAPIQWPSPEMEALWRMFYRTGGLSPKVFQTTIGQHCSIEQHPKGSVLPIHSTFYMVYSGRVQLTVSDTQVSGTTQSQTRIAKSGQMFDFRALQLLNPHSLAPAMTKNSTHKLESAVVLSEKAVVFAFERKVLPTIASHPRTRLLWKELLVENLLRIVQRQFHELHGNQEASRRSATGADKDDLPHKIFDPLLPSEMPDPFRAGSSFALRNPPWHVLKSAVWSFAPPWPIAGPPLGLRHDHLFPRQPPKQTTTTLTDDGRDDSEESRLLDPKREDSNTYV